MNQNLGCLRQGIALLERIDDDLFAATAPGLEAGGVGVQFRHVIDYYRCFLRDHRRGRIDYDLRERDEQLEASRSLAIQRLEAVVAELEALDLTSAPDTLEVKADAVAAAPREACFTESSPLRELQFLASHTVHHYALIAVILHGRGFDPGAAFGVAPSTLQHWDSSSGVGR